MGGASWPRPPGGVVCGAREAAGGGGSLRTVSRQVGSLLIQGFPRLRTGSGCSCSRGRGAGSRRWLRRRPVRPRPPSRLGPGTGPARLPPGPNPRPSQQVPLPGGRCPGGLLVPGYRSQDPTSAGCAAAPPPHLRLGRLISFFSGTTGKVVGACVNGLAEVCRCPSSASSQLALQCSLPGSPLLFQGRCFNSLLTFPASLCPAETLEDESDHV